MPPNSAFPRRGEWLRNNLNASPDRQQKGLENDPQFKRLPQQEQQRLRNQLRSFSNLPSDQRERVLQRMQRFERMTPEQQQHTRNLFQQLQSMPPDRRQQVRSAFHRLRAMPPSARQRELNSPDFQGQFSEQERNLIQGMTELNQGR